VAGGGPAGETVVGVVASEAVGRADCGGGNVVAGVVVVVDCDCGCGGGGCGVEVGASFSPGSCWAAARQ